MARKAAVAPMPRVEVRDNPWGEAPIGEGLSAHKDRFYLEGYSNKRHEWEQAMQDFRTDRTGLLRPPAPLQFRVQFVSVKGPDGQDRGNKYHEFASMGYRPLKWDDAKASFGITLEDADGVPCGSAQKGPDGNVYVGSQMAMIISREGAARNAAIVAQASDDQAAAIQDRANDAAAQFNRKMGLSARGATAFEFLDEGESAGD